MKKLLTVAALTIGFAGVAQADICGIVQTNAGRAAAIIIDAQAAQNNGVSTIINDFNRTSMQVRDARASNKNPSEMDGIKYFPVIVTKLDGTDVEIDIGHSYVVLADGDTAVSLNVLTNCGAGVASSHPFMRLSSLGGK